MILKNPYFINEIEDTTVEIRSTIAIQLPVGYDPNGDNFKILAYLKGGGQLPDFLVLDSKNFEIRFDP